MENEVINNLTSPPRSRSLCSGLLFSTASSSSDIAGQNQQNKLTAIPSLDFYLFTSPSSALMGSETLEVGECEQQQQQPIR